MFFDIGGWWLTCDHMFRRFGTPFAVDWIAKNVNGYVYTAAIPADPDLRVEATEYGARYARAGARGDPDYAAKIGAYLGTVLAGLRPRLRRLVARPPAPRDRAQLRLPRGAARQARTRSTSPSWPSCSRTRSTSTTATGRSTGCSTSPSSRRRSTCERSWSRHAGEVDDGLLGRLQNSAKDRNWDSIEALWKMKEEVKDDAELRAPSRPTTRRRDRRPPSRRPSAAGAFIAERLEPVPARVRLARGLEPRVHLPDVSARDGAGPRARPRLPRDRLRLPGARSRRMRRRHRGRLARRSSTGLSGEALERDAGGQRDQPADGPAHARPPLLHRPGHQRPPAARADRDRRKLVAGRRARRARGRHVPPLQRAARASSATRRRSTPARSSPAAGPEREAPTRIQPRDWVGTATESQLAFPYLVTVGLPREVPPEPAATDQR